MFARELPGEDNLVSVPEFSSLPDCIPPWLSCKRELCPGSDSDKQMTEPKNVYQELTH